MNLSNRVKNDARFIPDEAFINKLEASIKSKIATNKVGFWNWMNPLKFALIPVIVLLLLVSIVVIQTLNKNNVKAYAMERVAQKLQEYKQSSNIIYTKYRTSDGTGAVILDQEIWIDRKDNLFKDNMMSAGTVSTQIIEGDNTWFYSTQTLAEGYIQKNIGSRYFNQVFDNNSGIVSMLEEFLNNPTDNTIVELSKYRNIDAYTFITRSDPKGNSGTISYQYFSKDNFDFLGEKYYQVINGEKKLYTQTDILNTKEIDSNASNKKDIFSIDLSKFSGITVKEVVDGDNPLIIPHINAPEENGSSNPILMNN